MTTENQRIAQSSHTDPPLSLAERCSPKKMIANSEFHSSENDRLEGFGVAKTLRNGGDVCVVCGCVEQRL